MEAFAVRFTRTMEAPHRIALIEASITSIGARLDAGVSRRELARLLHTGVWHRIGKGYVVEMTTWANWRVEQRHLARVIVAAKESRGIPIFSHQSAAALLGLPFWGCTDSPPHVISLSAHGRSDSLVRHELDVPEDDITESWGFTHTTPNRTLVDLSMLSPAPESLVATADVVLGRSARSGRHVDSDAAGQWHEEMAARTLAAAGKRGVRLLRTIVDFADARADSPLESVSRWRFHEFNISVIPQFEVPARNGGWYFVDFFLPDHGVFGECDGRTKYLDPALRGNLSVGQMVLQEKDREDWVAATTNSRFIRWGASEASTTRRFGSMLTAFRIPFTTKVPRSRLLTHAE